MSILFVSNEGAGRRSGRPFSAFGEPALHATFTFEDMVRFRSRDERALTVDRERLEQAIAEISRHRAVCAEESESVLLIYVLVRRGLPVPRWLVHAAGRFRRAAAVRAWVQRHYGEDPLAVLASHPQVIVGYTTSTQRGELLGLGLAPERTQEFPGCTAAQAFAFPDCTPALEEGAARRLPLSLGSLVGAVLAGGINGRDLGTLAAAAERLGRPCHVITDLRRTPVPSTPWLLAHDVVPMDDYITAIAHAGAVVVPLRDVPDSAGEQTISLAQRVGTPVVASAVPATAHYVREGETGFTAPPGDAPALAAAIARALAHRADAALLECARRRDAEDSLIFQAWARRALLGD